MLSNNKKQKYHEIILGIMYMYVSGKFTAMLQNQHNEVRDLISGPGNYM